MAEQTYNFMNEQVKVGNNGQPISTAPITSSNATTSGTLSNVQTGASAPYTPPNFKAPVLGSDLNTNTTFPPAAAASNPTPFVGSLSDSLKYFQDLYTKQTAQVDAVQKERDSLKSVLNEGYDKLNTYGDVYKSTEASMGIPQMYEDLNKLNLQLADLSGAYDKEYARTETKGIQSGTPGIFYQGEQAAIQRQKAVEIGALSVKQAAMVGNLDLANQRAEKTVELQFKPIENKIKQTLDFINMNYQDMSAAEQRQANTLQNTLAFQSQQLQQQKEDRTNALMAGVPTRFFKYKGDNTVLDTSTGEKLTYEQYLARGGKPDFSNITEFNPMETQQVLQLASQYPDAGIKPSDDLATATAKLKNSRIYQEKVRPPQSSGSSSGLSSISILDKSTDAKVKSIIQSNQSKGWEETYQAVKREFGEQVAKSYDKVYGSVFDKGSSVDAAFNDAKIIMANTPSGEEIDKKQAETLAKVQASPEYKTINALLPALQAVKSYKDAIDKWGTYENWNGEGGGELSGTYGNALSAWKTLAGLGALSGADFALAENAIPSTGFWQRNSKAKAKLDTSLENAVKQAETLTTRLKQNYPDSSTLLDQQLDQMKVVAYPQKYKIGSDGKVYEIIQ